MPNPLIYSESDFTTSGGTVDAEQLRQEFASATFSSTPVVFSHVDGTDVDAASFTITVTFDTVPDGIDETAVDAIIAAHDATGPTPEVVAQKAIITRYLSNNGTYYLTHSSYIMDAAEATVVFQVPYDFTAFVSAHVVVVADAAMVARPWFLTTSRWSEGGTAAAATVISSAAYTLTAPIDALTHFDVTGMFSGHVFTPGDEVGFDSSPLDLTTETVYRFSLVFIYT